MTIAVFETLKGATPEARLAELGHVLPEIRQPVGNYCGAVTTGKLVFVAGHGTFNGPTQTHKGKLGAEVSVEDGYAGARNAVVSALASLKTEIGELSRVRRVVRLFGMVGAGFPSAAGSDRRRVRRADVRVRQGRRARALRGGLRGVAVRHADRTGNGCRDRLKAT
jgi:hypothetical protein